MEQPDAHAAEVSVEHDAAAHRFEIRFPEGVAFLKYHYDRAGGFHLDHTEVPPARQHHGVAALLAKTALDFAKDRGLTVVPRCPYVVAYLKEHPEFDSLLQDGRDHPTGAIQE